MYKGVLYLYLFRRKRILFTNIKTNKCFQNDVNSILFIDYFMFMTLKKLFGWIIFAVVSVERVLLNYDCYEPYVVVIN